MGSDRRLFEAEGEFIAYQEAEKVAKACGFSVGRMQRDEPIGLMFGDYDIQKWRNLRTAERAALHGTIRGDKRNGPVTLDIYDNAPTEAWIRWDAIPRPYSTHDGEKWTRHRSDLEAADAMLAARASLSEREE